VGEQGGQRGVAGGRGDCGVKRGVGEHHGLRVVRGLAHRDLEHGLTTSRRLLADTLNGARAVAKRTVALVDVGKFGRAALVPIAAATEFDPVDVDARRAHGQRGFEPPRDRERAAIRPRLVVGGPPG
jgi:hypothetical protein